MLHAAKISSRTHLPKPEAEYAARGPLDSHDADNWRAPIEERAATTWLDVSGASRNRPCRRYSRGEACEEYSGQQTASEPEQEALCKDTQSSERPCTAPGEQMLGDYTPVLATPTNRHVIRPDQGDDEEGELCSPVFEVSWAADVTMVMFSQLTVIHHHHRELEKPQLSPAETARCPINVAL
ncbi:unnamed protein product [Pleuronectes platessa]|uniref:Uncharacterized protein n=1 Tax=Pleuronectes platessa TaxID=8262 RepID=A0A9N7VNI8_PLEPL|nr:unnamed protein product [Pleuronectes platessa]